MSHQFHKQSIWLLYITNCNHLSPLILHTLSISVLVTKRASSVWQLQPGLSLMLGFNRCAHCSNMYLLLLPPFVLAGISSIQQEFTHNSKALLYINNYSGSNGRNIYSVFFWTSPSIMLSSTRDYIPFCFCATVATFMCLLEYHYSIYFCNNYNITTDVWPACSNTSCPFILFKHIT